MRWNDTEKERAVAGFVLRTKQYIQSATVFPKARGPAGQPAEVQVRTGKRKEARQQQSKQSVRERCMMRENVEREKD